MSNKYQKYYNAGGEGEGGGTGNEGEPTPEQIQAQVDADAAALAEQEKNKPVPITDEILFSEISKRYENIKSKEDFDRIASINEAEYIKPKSEFVKKLNDWQGEPELFLKVSKLDVEKLDNKSAIIQNMMIKDGVSEQIAELKFKKQFGAAFVSEKDEDGEDNPSFNKDEKLLAEDELNRAAVESKKALSQWKASSEESGFRKPEPIDEAKKKEAFENEWVKPVKQAIDSLQKISMETKYQLSDKTEVSEPFNYLTENADTKKVVADILTAPDSAVFMQKFMETFGKDETGKVTMPKLVEALTFLVERNSIIGQAMSVGGSKELAHHLANVKTGNLTEKQTSGTLNPTGQKALIDVMNKAYLDQFNKT